MVISDKKQIMKKLIFQYCITGIMALWPAILVNWMGDHEMQVIFTSVDIYPVGIDYIANHWLWGDAIWKSSYVRAWCINGYIVIFLYIIYLSKFGLKGWIIDAKKISFLKLACLIAFGMFCGWAWISGWIVSPETPLSKEIQKIIDNDFNLLVFFPVIWVSSYFVSVVTLLLVWTFFLKVSDIFKGAK